MSDAAGVVPGAGGPDLPAVPEPLPIWFECGLVVLAALVVSVGGFGLLLAVLGDYRLRLALVVGSAVTAGLSWLAWPRSVPRSSVSRRRRVWSVTLPAVVVVAVAVLSGVWNAAHAGQHASIGRDPGIYATTAKWIATRGSLQIPTSPEWATPSDAVSPVFPGAYAVGSGTSQFQFDHLTATLLAEADGLGGDRYLFRMPAILGALGLCAVYGAGCRLLRRPWLVAAAVTGLAVSMPQLNVSRDTFSETSVQILLWCGLGLLAVAYERRRPGMALLSGAALAGTVMSRIDAPIYLIPIPFLAALAWAADPSPARRRQRFGVYGAALAGAVPVALLGTYDIQHRAGYYYSDLHSQVHQLQEGFGVSIGAASVVLALGWALRRPLGRLAGALRRRGRPIGWFLGALGSAGVVAAWVVRPMVSTVRSTPIPLIGALQDLQGLAHDPRRTYAEHTLWWFTWYLGPEVVGLFCLGAGVLVARSCRRSDPAAVLVLACAGAGTALYLWKPSISPDQIWAMRRFAPAGLPTALLLAAAALSAVASVVARVWRGLDPVVVLVGVAALTVPPAMITWPVRNFVPGPGDGSVNLTGVEAACRATGPDAAILAAYDDADAQEIVGALRAWCQVPAATLNHALSPAELRGLAETWAGQHRTLWVLAGSAAAVSSTAPGTTPQLIVTVRQPHELQLVVEKAPPRYSPMVASLYGAVVAPG